MKPLISVLIPLYNAMPYFPKAIESVMGQTYDNLEIIIIDDGSKDDSGAEADRYAAKDERIRVIRQENHGVCYTRNRLIEAATGEYVIFADNDDIMHPRAIELLYDGMMKIGAGLAMGAKESFTKEAEPDIKVLRTEYSGLVPYPEKMSGRELLLNRGGKLSGLNVVIWGKLYRREDFKDITYPEDRRYDDAPTTYKLLYPIEKIAYMPCTLFYYRISETSLSNSINTETKLVELRRAYMEQAEFYNENNEVELRAYALNHAQSALAELILRYKTGDEKSRDMARELRSEYRTINKIIQTKYLKTSERIKLKLFTVSEDLYSLARDFMGRNK